MVGQDEGQSLRGDCGRIQVLRFQPDCLRPVTPVFYAGTVVVSLPPMQRLTARLLVLFALVGNILPLALAATSAPAHACCVRKTHHCHESASVESTVPESERPSIHAAECGHECCRAASTSQWARLQSPASLLTIENVEARVADLHPAAPTVALAASQSTRAPPSC